MRFGRVIDCSKRDKPILGCIEEAYKKQSSGLELLIELVEGNATVRSEFDENMRQASSETRSLVQQHLPEFK